MNEKEHRLLEGRFNPPGSCMDALFVDCHDGIQHLTIDLAQDWEVRFWTRKLDVSEADLRRAVAAGGLKAVQVIQLLTAWSGAMAS